MQSKPLIVGVTGGIGSGKSTVCKVFEILGAKTYYADDRAKWLMENDPKLKSEIKGLFGESVYLDGRLDRAYIAKQVFKNDGLLKELNDLVHPAVALDVEAWVRDNKDTELLLKEAALLFETGSYKSLNKNILVTAPKETRLSRVISRDVHRTEDDIRAIMKKQLSDEEKRPLADFEIINDGRKSIIKEVLSIHKELTNLK